MKFVTFWFEIMHTQEAPCKAPKFTRNAYLGKKFVDRLLLLNARVANCASGHVYLICLVICKNVTNCSSALLPLILKQSQNAHDNVMMQFIINKRTDA